MHWLIQIADTSSKIALIKCVIANIRCAIVRQTLMVRRKLSGFRALVFIRAKILNAKTFIYTWYNYDSFALWPVISNLPFLSKNLETFRQRLEMIRCFFHYEPLFCWALYSQWYSSSFVKANNSGKGNSAQVYGICNDVINIKTKIFVI